MGSVVPIWLQIAVGELGQAEIPGPCDNPRISEYGSMTVGGPQSDDEVPWCSEFACWCVEKAGLQSPRSKRAASWLTWGRTVTCQIGAVVVFKRVGGHHVGFVLDYTGTMLYVIGGNQCNRVGVAAFARDRALDFRLPEIV